MDKMHGHGDMGGTTAAPPPTWWRDSGLTQEQWTSFVDEQRWRSEVHRAYQSGLARVDRLLHAKITERRPIDEDSLGLSLITFLTTRRQAVSGPLGCCSPLVCVIIQLPAPRIARIHQCLRQSKLSACPNPTWRAFLATEGALHFFKTPTRTWQLLATHSNSSRASRST